MRLAAILLVAGLCWVSPSPLLAAGQSARQETVEAGTGPAANAGTAASTENERSTRVERRYFRPEQREDAGALALAEARAALRDGIAKELAARSDIRFASSPLSGAAGTLNVPALAHAVSIPRAVVQYAENSDGSGLAIALCHQDSAETKASGGVDETGERIRAVLPNSEVMDLYSRATLREEALLGAFRAVALAWPHLAEKNVPADPALAMTDKLAALEAYFTVLPHLNGLWQKPETVYAAMRDAVRLDPENALYRNALGEAALLLGLSHEALDAESEAVRLDPTFARAYHARGTAQLALQLPALAVADFSEAIRLNPQNATYRVDRAAALLLREDYTSMCGDLYEACALGECRAFEWAVTEKLCTPHSGGNTTKLPGIGK